jgi:hypothetical protein
MFARLPDHLLAEDRLPSTTALTLRSEAPRSKPMRCPTRLRPRVFPVSREAGTSSAVQATTEKSLSYTSLPMKSASNFRAPSDEYRLQIYSATAPGAPT